MKKPTVTIISPGLLEAATERGGGIEEIDLNVAFGLSRHFDVSIIGPFFRKFLKRYELNGILIEQINFPAMRDYPPKTKLNLIYITFFLIPLYSFLVAKKIFFIRPKLIIVHNGLPGLFSSIIAKLLKIKIIYSEGNMQPWTNSTYKSPKLSNPQIIMRYINLSMGIMIANLSDLIRVQDDIVKRGMIEFNIKPKKICIIPGAVDPNLFKPNDIYDLDSQVLNVGFIGRLCEEKGIQMLLEIAQLALNKDPTINFIIFGEGPCRVQLAKCTNIKCMGIVNRKDLSNKMKNIPIIVSFQNQLGLAEIEAMSMGKVIIIGESNGSGIQKIIKHLDNGIICPTNSEYFLNAIKLLKDNPCIIKKLSKNARKTVVDSLSWEIINEKWISLCIKCLEYQ